MLPFGGDFERNSPPLPGLKVESCNEKEAGYNEKPPLRYAKEESRSLKEESSDEKEESCNEKPP
jgi:hypothetical protein